MTNDLKNFLEGEIRLFNREFELIDYDISLKLINPYLKDKDTRLITFVLNLVEKEVEKTLVPPIEWKECVKAYHNRDDYCAVCGFNPDTLSCELSTIINNLRV